jgi:hypothetical protein
MAVAMSQMRSKLTNQICLGLAILVLCSGATIQPGLCQAHSGAATQEIKSLQKAADQGDDRAQASLEATHSQGKAVPLKNSASNGSGNFGEFQATIQKTGLFNSEGVANGFSLYQGKENKLNFISMRPWGGYCCEGVVAVQPMDDTDLEGYIMFV